MLKESFWFCSFVVVVVFGYNNNNAKKLTTLSAAVKWNNPMEKKAEIIFELYEDWKTSGGRISWLTANQASEGTTYNNNKTAAFFIITLLIPLTFGSGCTMGIDQNLKQAHIVWCAQFCGTLMIYFISY